MNIYTRAGDKGTTRIVGGKVRRKDDIRIETNGMLDEANAFIGMLRSKLPQEHYWQKGLFKIQTDIMDMMSHIATPSEVRDRNDINKPIDGAVFCEQWIDQMLEEIPKPHNWFLLPGGTKIAALCHVIRTKIRTAERRLVTLNEEDSVEQFIPEYINRLSDLFFVMSRYELYKANLSEEKLRPFRKKRPKK